MSSSKKNPTQSELNDQISNILSDDITHASQIYGDWGPFQRNVAIYFALIYVIAPFQNFGITFFTPNIDYNCSKPSGAENQNVSKCFEFDGSPNPCTEWEFDHSFYQSTVIDEFNLVCDRRHYVSIAMSIYQIGYLIASIVTSWMADKHGRIFTFRVCVIIELFACLSQALAMNIHQFLISRFFLGIGAYGRFTTSSTLMVELVGPSNRAFIKMGLEIGWSVGLLLLPVVNYAIPHFRYIQGVVIVYELIFLIGLWKMPESPRWLITHGRFEEAVQLITKVAKINGKFMKNSSEIESKLANFKRYLTKEEENLKTEAQKTMIDLWKVHVLRRYLLIFCAMTFMGQFVYYSFTYNAANFGSSIHISMFVQAIAEALVVIMAISVVNRWKRKKTALISAMLCVLLIFGMVPFTFTSDQATILTTMSFVGKFFFMAFGYVVFVWRDELFPTTLRQWSVGTTSVIGRIGSIAAPYSKELTNITHFSVVVALHGTMVFIKAILIMFLPETTGREMPDTIEEARVAFSNNKRSGEREFRE